MLIYPCTYYNMTAVGRSKKYYIRQVLHFQSYFANPINTNILSATVLTISPHPNFIELVDGRLHKFRVIGKDASFKVAAVFTLHAHTCARKVSRSDVCRLRVKYHQLKKYPRTAHPFQYYNTPLKYALRWGVFLLSVNTGKEESVSFRGHTLTVL